MLDELRFEALRLLKYEINTNNRGFMGKSKWQFIHEVSLQPKSPENTPTKPTQNITPELTIYKFYSHSLLHETPLGKFWKFVADKKIYGLQQVMVIKFKGNGVKGGPIVNLNAYPMRNLSGPRYIKPWAHHTSRKSHWDHWDHVTASSRWAYITQIVNISIDQSVDIYLLVLTSSECSLQ